MTDRNGKQLMTGMTVKITGAYFKKDKEEKKIERDSRLFGEESEEVYREREYLAHYRNVIQRIERG